MSPHDAYDRILALLYKAALDDAHWPATSALIDDACQAEANGLVVGEGFGEDAKVYFANFYFRGQRRQDVEHDYFTLYHPRDERMPRLRQLPDGHLVHVADLYTAEELKTSPVYNEGLSRLGSQNGLNVRLDGPAGLRIVWAFADPTEAGGWGSAQIGMIERLLPHVRQFVCVRQALVGAAALGASLSELLDSTRVGVVYLDRRGHIVEANGPARDLLRRGDGLCDQGGYLQARLPADNNRLGRLLANALPGFGGQAPRGASMTVWRAPGVPGLTVHISPVDVPQADLGALRVAALVLVVDPSRPRIDPHQVALLLGLTRAESQVAVMLSEGKTVRDIAMARGRQEHAVYWLLKQIYRKLGVSRQADLVRLVLSLPQVSSPRR